MTQLVRFRHLGEDRLGVVSNDSYIDLTKSYAHFLSTRGVMDAKAAALGVLPPDMLAYFRGGSLAFDALREAVGHAKSLEPTTAAAEGIVIDRSGTEVLVPIPNPPKIVCVARNFGKHAEEAGLQVSEIPILFPRFANTLIADGEAILVPKVSREVDWEGELAVVIGVGGHRISKADALSHVAGYTIFNDVSVRDYQFRVAQYTGGKNFRSSGPIGPYVTLVDEEFDPHNLQIVLSVNGVRKQDGNTNEFIFDIPTIIEHISEFIPLEPGDIIPMGTPAGVGFKRNPPEFLTDGDIVEVTIERIGTLTNPVVAE